MISLFQAYLIRVDMQQILWNKSVIILRVQRIHVAQPTSNNTESEIKVWGQMAEHNLVCSDSCTATLHTAYYTLCYYKYAALECNHCRVGKS